MPEFDDQFRARLHDLFAWRRDVRRFRSDPLPEDALGRLIDTACLAPSVGLSQPWRFVIVDDPARRQAVLENFTACNEEALGAFHGERAQLYATLKLAGLREAPCHLAVFADRETDVGHGVGRRTMPEMAEYSAVSAVMTLWLAARAEGIGVGWVSILDPDAIKATLNVPAHWRLIGYFCIGYPETEDDRPELERVGWERRRPATDLIVRR
ncbi:5,6-dimethylbenzimidazole synthase [Tardiphaga alba]|uniref:5,6-dimethylbenzimidazole synthase n=1 Tax=Tardiphaga alba TaxID=340268 RepID=A0ABX8AAA6_9BRAD|nr:5,6-dimethylbenzimidazole synthase [Tardiphaga alba]QUS40412.1 5,6-dimethylbenzimidazole synthase [Tardiphaga alba]